MLSCRGEACLALLWAVTSGPALLSADFDKRFQAIKQSASDRLGQDHENIADRNVDLADRMLCNSGPADVIGLSGFHHQPYAGGHPFDPPTVRKCITSDLK